MNKDFHAVVEYEKGKKVSAYYYPSYKAMYDESFGSLQNYDWNSGTWFNSEGMFTVASWEMVEYYVDPRNFLDPQNIYMFMRQELKKP